MPGIRRIGTAMAALAVMAAPLAAQGGRGPAEGRMMRGPAAMMRNPVEVVLEHRADLELTAEQVRTLEALRDRVEEENAPRVERLREAFGDTDPRELSAEERDALRARMRELAPVRDEVRATNRAAMDQVHELLTDEQRGELRQFMRRRMGPRGEGRGMQHRGGRRGG
jgi:hypothetical protein